MRAVETDIIHLTVFSLPFYVLVALTWFGIRAYRDDPAVRRYKWRHSYPVLFLLVYVVSAPLFPSQLVSTVEDIYPVPVIPLRGEDSNDVIIVLTAGWLRLTNDGYEQKIGEQGWERTVAAVELWRKVGGRLLFTGAPAPDGGSAADKMAHIAKEMGVPESTLRVERESINTYENFVFSKRLIDSTHGKLWLVTSALHMPRSVAIARRIGLEVIPYPCDYHSDRRLHWRMFIPSNQGAAALENVLHELLGILVYRWRGWI